MTFGSDFAGFLNVTGLLNSLAIGGGRRATSCLATSIYYCSGRIGNKVLQVIEGNRTQIQTMPVAGGTLPDTILFTSIRFERPGDPKFAIQITNNGKLFASFDLPRVLQFQREVNLSLCSPTAKPV